MDSELFLTVMMLIMAVLYTYVFYLSLKRIRNKRTRKQFFHAITSVLKNNDNEDNCIKQINLNFKKLSSKPSNIKNSVDLLEEMVFKIDTLNEKTFLSRYGIEMTSEIRGRIIGIIETMKEKNPFDSLSPKEANLLESLKHALETENKDLGHTIIKQLSDEMEILEANIDVQNDRNKNSYVIAAVGIVLTIYFGVLSLLKF